LQLGSGRQATDAAGVVQAYTILDEWGKPLEKVKAQFGGVEIDLISNYTNHDFDELLQVYYAKARFYDPNTQRFLAVDIIKGNVLEPESMNPYLYVLNNPLLYLDFDGREKVNVNGEIQDWFTIEKNGKKYVGIQNIMSAYGLNPQAIGNTTGGINITVNGSRTPRSRRIQQWNFNISLNSSGLNARAVFYRYSVREIESYNLGDHMAGLMIDYDYFSKLMCQKGFNADIGFKNKYISPYGDIPVNITSLYGYRSSQEGIVEFHGGFDLKNALKSEIYSISEGIVIAMRDGQTKGQGIGYGNHVIIQYDDPVLGEFQVLYAHLHEFDTNLKGLWDRRVEGEQIIVKQNQLIGFEGSTGIGTSSHLHMQAWYGNELDLVQTPDRNFNPLTELYDIKMTKASIDNSINFNLLSGKSDYSWNKRFLNGIDIDNIPKKYDAQIVHEIVELTQ
jgi:RHS repeat-associated protein